MRFVTNHYCPCIASVSFRLRANRVCSFYRDPFTPRSFIRPITDWDFAHVWAPQLRFLARTTPGSTFGWDSTSTRASSPVSSHIYSAMIADLLSTSCVCKLCLLLVSSGSSLFSRTSLAFNQFCLLQHNIFNMIATSQHGSSRPLIERLQSSVIIFITHLYSGFDRLTASPSIVRSVFHLYYPHIGHLFIKRVFLQVSELTSHSSEPLQPPSEHPRERVLHFISTRSSTQVFITLANANHA